MAFYVGSTNYFPGIFPLPTTQGNGSPLVANSVTQAFWAYPGSSQGTPAGVLETRSLLTHGYTAGGYKDAIAWRSVNKTWHANDVTLYCGEQLKVGAAYAAGTFSDYNGYQHGAGGGYATASTHTDSYNLGTGVSRTVNLGLSGANPGGPFGYAGKDPTGDGQGIAYGGAGAPPGVGSWELSVGRTYFAGTQNQIGQVGYITGGSESTACDKFNFPTEIMYIGTSSGITGQHATAAGGATSMFWSLAGQMRKMLFSTDTWSTWAPGTAAAPDGVCKMLSTKLGYHYVGSGSNSTTPVMKWSDTTGTTLTAALAKPSAQGEENFQMGQNWGYCLGAFNGQQNNYTFKVTYSNDAFTVMGSTTQPKGHAGMSSGVCSSAAASITMSNI